GRADRLLDLAGADRGSATGHEPIANAEGEADRQPRIAADVTAPVQADLSALDGPLHVLVEIPADLGHPSANLIDLRLRNSSIRHGPHPVSEEISAMR